MTGPYGSWTRSNRGEQLAEPSGTLEPIGYGENTGPGHAVTCRVPTSESPLAVLTNRLPGGVVVIPCFGVFTGGRYPPTKPAAHSAPPFTVGCHHRHPSNLTMRTRSSTTQPNFQRGPPRPLPQRRRNRHLFSVNSHPTRPSDRQRSATQLHDQTRRPWSTSTSLERLMMHVLPDHPRPSIGDRFQTARPAPHLAPTLRRRPTLSTTPVPAPSFPPFCLAATDGPWRFRRTDIEGSPGQERHRLWFSPRHASSSALRHGRCYF